MEILLMSRLLLLTLATLALASQILGLEDTGRSHLYGEEGDEEDFPESNEDIFEETQRSANSGEENEVGVRNMVKMSVPLVHRIPHASANLPLRFGRAFLEEAKSSPAFYSPLRYESAFDERIRKSVPNLPQRFGRYLASKRSIQPLANLPQRFGRAPSAGQFIQSLANLPQRFGRSIDLHNFASTYAKGGKESGYGDKRMVDADNGPEEEQKEEGATQNNWNQNHNQMVM
ncbi:pro-FMRFamide-related neuropeptide VF [Lissotriton helveticus]